ncbi:MAG: hypothetical protein H7Z13_11535 [Ferruginibacter sp.]|nr:hypothetical protein [Ferruginibacter sp.]
MNSITKDYLTGIIFKKASETIDQHRQLKQPPFDNNPYPGATDEEVLDFIICIPFFDEKLKDFLLGNLVEDTIIISQAWENEFIKKTCLWAQGFGWLNGNDHYPGEAQISSINTDRSFLTLPY